MPAERFYIKDQSFELTGSVIIEKEEFHHLHHVMRIKVGEVVDLVDGIGSLAQAQIQSIDKHKATLQIQSLDKILPTENKIILAQALPRLPKLEYIIEKSVELGVTDIWLFPGTLSEKKELSASQDTRIQNITISAMKQCGRLFLPKIIQLPSILSWTSENLPQESFFGDTDSSAPPFLKSLQNLKSSSVLIAIGPEKGFHEKETIHMKNNLRLNGIKLHQNILRTETAAVHSISLLSSFIFKN
jgi:16S rRNA (uracil1498-N3)-methyltransferase